MKTVLTLLITLLLFSSLFFVVADKVEAQQRQLCCQNTPTSCVDNDGGTIAIKCDNPDANRFDEVCNFDTRQCQLESRDVPTLSEWGLIALAGTLGIIGFIMVIRRRKALA